MLNWLQGSTHVGLVTGFRRTGFKLSCVFVEEQFKIGHVGLLNEPEQST